MRQDPVRVAAHIVLYVVFWFVGIVVFGWALGDFAFPAGAIAANLIVSGLSNWMCLRIFEGRHLLDAGLWWNRASGGNLVIGLLGGAAAATLVLAPPLLVGAAHLVRTPADPSTFGTFVYVAILLAAAAVAEELQFRGYGFQILLQAVGPY